MTMKVINKTRIATAEVKFMKTATFANILTVKETKTCKKY